MFRRSHFPRVMMNPQEANYAYLRGEVELVSLRDAEGRIAAEGALPYPPGCCAWFRGSLGRFRAALLRRAGRRINLLPGFAPELQGFTSRSVTVANRCAATSSNNLPLSHRC